MNEHNKHFTKHFNNGIIHLITLWIISKERIHGYGIMKKLDELFIGSIQSNTYKKTSSSKIYPTLKRMEKRGLITGRWETNENNKKVKYYEITSEGKELLELIQIKWAELSNNPIWREFISDMSGKA